MTEPILEVDKLCRYFAPTGLRRKQRALVRAVDNVSFTVGRGEIFGIVGESGCGKSTLGKTILRLLEPSSGTARFEGEDIYSAGGRELARLRRKMQIVFQDPYASLDPHMSIRSIVREPLDIAAELPMEERTRRIESLMERVGMHRDYLDRFPYEFSGGQRQRICIARALALEPKLLVCDEPVSALDVSVQSQVLNLFRDLQEELGLTYLFISHDLSVIQHISDRICVMYLGQVVELGSTERVYSSPAHPYSKCLLSAALKPIPASGGTAPLPFVRGDAGGKAVPENGCRFCPRCPYATAICREQPPELKEVEPGRLVRCHHV